MWIRQPNAESPSAPRRRGPRCARRGVVTLLSIWALIIILLIAAWVINYNYLVLVNRNMQQKSDAVALAAAPELLDEDFLWDYPTSPVPDQTDDFEDAKTVAGQYCQWNNQIQAEALSIRAGDATLKSGFVADITGRSPYEFDRTIPLDDPHPPHNTLRVCFRRLADGNHPVRYVLDLFGGGQPRAADVSGGAFATLDNLVVGFRPTVQAASPVMPMAILVDAWNSERPGGDDSNDNRIRELVLRLQISGGTPPGAPPSNANAVVLLLDGTFNPAALSDQVASGLFPGDLPSGVLGPATPTSPWTAKAVQRTECFGQSMLHGMLAMIINHLAVAGELERVFPVYETFTDANHDGVGHVRLIGFVACNVLSAEVSSSENQFRVTVEPCFIIHNTAWTVAPDHPVGPVRNPYVHKLRLSH